MKECDEITLAGSDPLVLEMTNDIPSGLEVNYTIKMVLTYEDGATEDFHGKRSIIPEDGLYYEV